VTTLEVSNNGHDTADFLRISVSLATLMKTYAWSSCLIREIGQPLRHEGHLLAWLPVENRRISRRFWPAAKKVNLVAQAFQPAGSRDIPVACFKSPRSRFASKMATGKSPEPADKNVCVTPPQCSPASSAQ
jgi:hypothetical protein